MGMIYKLDNPLQYYEWGSPSLIPDFLGLPNPEKTPVAELWMGTHPKAPSRVEIEGKSLPLPDLIRREPAAILGSVSLGRFGPGLPFLFKVLAADKPLSIQCHPDLPGARAGFARENRLGIPLDSPVRNYRDPNHKPEILLALTPFAALRGFRPVREIADNFAAFPVKELAGLGRELIAPDPGPAAVGSGSNSAAAPAASSPADGALKDFLRRLLSAPRDVAAVWIGECLADGAGEGERGAEGASPDRTASVPEWTWFRRLADLYPGDPGCFAPFYLNLVFLKPGEAVYLGAGELHAYLEGLGVELMANSDNVLRGGLTGKHIDIEELLAVLSPKAGRAEVLRPRTRSLGGGWTEDVYETPAEEFALSVLRSGDGGARGAAARIDVAGPEILLCGGGEAEITMDDASGSAPGETVLLRRGESAFISASVGRCTLTGRGVLYRARVPE
jgi:mannose-6-phosphate isomerase